MITGMNHAVLYVRDARRQQKFYEDVLDFETIVAGPDGAFVFLRAPGSPNHHDLACFTIGADAGSSTAGREQVGFEPEHRHLGTVRGEQLGDPGTDPPGRAGDEHAPTAQARREGRPRRQRLERLVDGVRSHAQRRYRESRAEHGDGPPSMKESGPSGWTRIMPRRRPAWQRHRRARSRRPRRRQRT